MQEDTSARFESELKIKALTSGIAELIGLAILLAYIISNITTVTENLEEESSIEAFDGIFSANSILLMNNEILTWLAGVISIIMLMCTLFTIGVQKGKRWLMVPYIIIHVMAIAFFAIVWIVLGVKFRHDGWMVLHISMCAAFLIGCTSIVFKPAFTYFLFLEIMKRMNKEESILSIVV